MSGSEFSITRVSHTEIISRKEYGKMEALGKELTYIMFKFLSNPGIYTGPVLFFFHSANVYCMFTGWVLRRIQRWVRTIYSYIEKEDISSENVFQHIKQHDGVNFFL